MTELEITEITSRIPTEISEGSVVDIGEEWFIKWSPKIKKSESKKLSYSVEEGAKFDIDIKGIEKEKMVLRVPLEKAKQVGMRKLADDGVMEGAMKTLRGRARVKRTMWSRRAQEYEAKINSGDLVATAEVVRDLYRNENQPEQSYSERQLYESALDRMAREVAAINKTELEVATANLEDVLSKATTKTSAADEASEDE